MLKQLSFVVDTVLCTNRHWINADIDYSVGSFLEGCVRTRFPPKKAPDMFS